jgi:hypothetical protein
MWRNYRLLFGPLAATLLFLGIVALGLVVPGYSQSPLVGFSWAVTGLVWISIALKLSATRGDE